MYYKLKGSDTVYEKHGDHFYPAGGGWCVKDNGGFYEIPDPYVEFQPHWVGADFLDGVWPCMWNGELWNGWGTPWFSTEVGKKLIVTMNATSSEYDGKHSYDEEEDVFFYIHAEDNAVPFKLGFIEVAGVRYHAIGDSYTWDKPIKASRIAEEFLDVLKMWLSGEEYAEMVRLNITETDPYVCHSHDYCDANMAMDQAFQCFNIKTCVDHAEDAEADRDRATDLWNEAWQEAIWMMRKRPTFTSTRPAST